MPIRKTDRALPVPTIEQAQALLERCNTGDTPATIVTYLLRHGCISYVTLKKYQASQKFKDMNAKRQLRRRVRTMSLDEQRMHLRKWEDRLAKAQSGSGDVTHQDRFDKLLGKVMALRRSYAVRLGYDPDELNERGELADIVGDTEQHELAKEMEANADHPIQ